MWPRVGEIGAHYNMAELPKVPPGLFNGLFRRPSPDDLARIQRLMDESRREVLAERAFQDLESDDAGKPH